MRITESSLQRVSGLTSSGWPTSAWLRQDSSSLAELHLMSNPFDALEGWQEPCWTDVGGELPKDEGRWARIVKNNISAKRSGLEEIYLWNIASNSSRNLFFVFCRIGEFPHPQLQPPVAWHGPVRVQANTEAPVAPSENPLVVRIVDERKRAHVDADSEARADAAVMDAISLVQQRGLDGAPNVALSADGILSLQWQKDELGVALLFAGDGIVSIAFRRPGQLYAENGIDISVKEELPESFKTMLSAVVS
jgi:hypothetical protein